MRTSDVMNAVKDRNVFKERQVSKGEELAAHRG